VTYLGFVDGHGVASHQWELCSRKAAASFTGSEFGNQAIGVYSSALAIVEFDNWPHLNTVPSAKVLDLNFT